MRGKLKIVGLISALALVGACANNGQPVVGGMGSKELGGTIIGAGLGGLAGSALGGKSTGGKIGTVAGVLIGGFVGNQIGQSLDSADRLAHEQTVQKTLETAPTGQRLSWNNPDKGTSGYVVARQPIQRPVQQVYGQQYAQAGYQPNEMTVCREYTQTIQIGGNQQPQTLVGQACRQADGSWKPVNG